MILEAIYEMIHYMSNISVMCILLGKFRIIFAKNVDDFNEIR